MVKDKDERSLPPTPSPEDIQQWTQLMARGQEMMLDFAARQVGQMQEHVGLFPGLEALWPDAGALADPAKLAKAQVALWTEGLTLWEKMLSGSSAERQRIEERADRDRRFAAAQWKAHPMFDLLRQSYLLICDHMLGSVDAAEGLDGRQKEQLRFATRAFLDAMSPSNFPMTNPEVLERAMETKGESLLSGLAHMLRDIEKGQLTHTAEGAFELGRNIAVTPGRVVKRTPLYELIQYSPATETVFETPLVIFPPWINRFYILDLNPQKSFIRWAVERGLTVFVVSWKSADESLAGVTMDDYVIHGQVDAIDTIRDLLGVPSVHTIGYCVAGTTLAATLAWLEAKGEAEKVASATFFTAQVDFADAGDLSLFVTDEQLGLIETLSAEKGVMDGRYMAATFNMLRGRDLVWNYVTANYLKGEDYPPFDLLHWNGDTTNLPAKWHQAYLRDLYRDNKLVQPGALNVAGVPIDLNQVKTPTYVQAGREDHIAPAKSVWKITHHFEGPLRFVLAGSGHIAGVVNPPEAQKYQYWTNEAAVQTLDDFIAGATETKGSWWPDWLGWIAERSGKKIAAATARIPGEGKLKALEDAPGTYVRTP
ncbi:PHA/PHB synthase family protein [Allosphingosinicella vermicomposti]|uniref:PHA/PHB synthase family protein n=1 Tax=Allosphingosinicella vermicomposti TaxID=614671 RepID=UPI000D113FEA|nr:class I poly(R)-hydroxyalkanoic acid synthase [Allosphingosinicella vermicomposti]